MIPIGVCGDLRAHIQVRGASMGIPHMLGQKRGCWEGRGGPKDSMLFQCAGALGLGTLNRSESSVC